MPSVQIVFPIIHLKNEFLAALLVYENSGIYVIVAKCSCNARHTSVSTVMRCVAANGIHSTAYVLECSPLQFCAKIVQYMT
jgi:hypothetical protein